MSADIGLQMQQLYSQFGKMPGISIELHKELLAIRVDNQQASATVFLQGAQLSHYELIARQKPIIWCSPLCDYQQGQSLRGGIPVCWPWFGDLAQNPAPVQQAVHADKSQLGAHGFVRDRLWSLSAVENINNGHTRLTLQLSLAEGEEPLWPQACELQLGIDISDTLKLQLQISNNSSKPMVFSSALHSYFAIGDVEQITVNGLEDLSYIDTLDNNKRKTQHTALTIDREVDRIYQGTQAAISLIDKGWQRVITLNSQGSNSAVLWNPWQDKARRLSHFANDAYQEMLCIETANAADDFVQLPAGEQHRLGLTISNQTLS